MPTFLDAQFGFAEETTFGTRVAPSRFLEFLQENISFKIDYIQSKAYRSGRLTRTRRRPGGQRVLGDITLELAPQGIGLLLKHLFGTVSTAGTNPYTHTFTPGTVTGKSLSIQIARTDQGGTARPFDYTGCKITDWELAAKAGEIATLKATIYGVSEVTNQTLATATYPTGWLPFVYTEGSLTIAGTGTPISEVSIVGNNQLKTDRYRLQATNPARSLEPVPTDMRDYTGKVVADFVDLTAYNRYVNQTAATLALTFNSGASAQLVVTLAVEFDGDTPNATGMGNEVMQPLPFMSLSTTSDATVATVALTNADSTP